MATPGILSAEREPLRWQDWLALGVIFTLSLWLLHQFRNAIIDDSFIYLRVAENILQGHGWVFNPGERVNPCTSSMYLILLVAIRFFFDSPVTALLTGFGGGLIAMGGIQYLAIRRESRTLALAISLASICEPLLFRSVGMETTIFLTCLLAAAWAYQRNAQVWCGIFCALTALNRPEGLALILICSGIHAIRRQKAFLKAQTAFLILLVPWLVFSRLYFGSVISNSIAAKAAQSELATLYFHLNWGTMLLHRMWIAPVTIGLAVLGSVLACLRIRNGNCYLAIPIVFGAVQIAAYSLLRAPFNYKWYYAPANLAINSSVIVAVFWLVEKALLHAPSRMWRQGTALIASLLLVSRLGAVPFEVPEPYDSGYEYIAVSNWIKQHSPESSRVACVEIGYLGYFSRRPILDMAGLIHPEALSYVRKLQILWWYDPKNAPDFIVMHQPSWPGEPDPRWGPLWSDFANRYELAIQIGSVQVFRRR